MVNIVQVFICSVFLFYLTVNKRHTELIEPLPEITDVPMKKLTGSAILAVVLMLMVLILMAGAGYSSANTDQTDTKAELQTLSHDIQQMKKMLETLNKARTEAQQQVQKNDTSISTLQKEVRTIEQRLKEGQGEIKKLQSRQTTLTAKSSKQKDQIARNLRSMYLTRSEGRLKLLLNQKNPEDISRQMVYLEHLQNAHFRAIQSFESTITELSSVEKQQQKLVTELSRQKVILEKKNEILIQKKAERHKQLVMISRKRRQGGRELNEMENQKKQLEEVLAQLTSRSLSGSRPFNDLRGKMPWPVKGKVLFGYNQERPDTRMRWNGVFIEASPGSPVKAVHDGRVIFSDWMRGYGLLTIVDHGNDFLTLYAHNQTVLKGEGDIVLAGEPLAHSGQTGGQSRTGVYFEVRKNGRPQNPGKWLSR